MIAHNSAFERRFAKQIQPIIANKGWGCSLAEVPWADAGIGSAKLDYLAMCFGLFHTGHRAIADCEMLLELLARPFPETGKPTLGMLLRTREYRWNDGTDGNPKAWYKDVPEADLESEKAYLQGEIYSGPFEPNCIRITAMTRFSDRIGETDRSVPAFS